MKKLLIILLLIVGCAPTKPPTATFYIGMSIEEFKNKNKTVNLKTTPMKIMDQSMSIENEGSSNEYIFLFANDTLGAVFQGSLNLLRKKEIDYSKYPDSKPEWFTEKPNKDIKMTKKLQDFAIRIIGTGILLYIVFKLYLAFAP